MMKLLLTGVTGAAGSQILRDAVSDPTISSITVLVRRALPVWLTGTIPDNTKMSTVVLDDFLHYPADLPAKLAAHDACIWALGCSSIGMSEEKYTKITYDYVVSMVSALQSGDVATTREDKEPFCFVFISAEGADGTGQTPKTMFGRIKSRTERFLFDLSPDSKIKASVLRPGYFYPKHKEYIRNTRSSAERVLSVALLPIMSTFVSARYTPIEGLSRIAIDAAKGRWGNETVFSNNRMRELLKGEGKC